MTFPKFKDEFLKKIGDIFLSNKEKYGEIFLVGGYIRDSLINKESHDLDFLVSKNSALAAKCIADSFGGVFYLLDHRRQTARAIIKNNNSRMVIDVAVIAGRTIFDDLAHRDFSINAIAVNLQDLENIIDPLNGVQDLNQKVLRPCSITSFSDDPVRVLRAVRFIREYSLSINEGNKKLIKQAANQIGRPSVERIRDALCQIFNIEDVNATLQLLIELGIFKELFSELMPLKSILASPPHIDNAFSHSLQVSSHLHEIIRSIYLETWFNDSSLYRDIKQLTKNFGVELTQFLKNYGISFDLILPLMVMSALYHDIGKTVVRSEIRNNKVTYPNHAEKSTRIVREKMKAFAFSNQEISLASTVVRHHMDAELKNSDFEEPARAIHRYFKNCGNVGIFTVFFHLADLISTYGSSMPTKRWNLALKSAENLLNGWFTQYNMIVSPPTLIDGNDLMDIFSLAPGREIGVIINRIKEEQAANTICDRKSAIKFVEENMKLKR